MTRPHFAWVIIPLSCIISSGCRDSQKIDGKVLSGESGKPIADATVVVHTSTGHMFDRNQCNWFLSTDKNGVFTYDAFTGRLEGVYAIAPGWYPWFLKNNGVICLNKIPTKALPIKKGSVSVTGKEIISGFSFARDAEIEEGMSDIVPSRDKVKGQISSLSARGQGGFHQIPVTGSAEHLRVKCIFVNALEAPNDNYDQAIDIAKGGGVWYVKCADGLHYAKILETHGSSSPDGSRSCFFEYVFQPIEGDRSLASNVTLAEFEKCLLHGKRVDLRSKY